MSLRQVIELDPYIAYFCQCLLLLVLIHPSIIIFLGEISDQDETKVLHSAEVLFADLPFISKYIYKAEKLKWAHSTWAGKYPMLYGMNIMDNEIFNSSFSDYKYQSVTLTWLRLYRLTM